MKINKHELIEKRDFREHLIVHALTETFKGPAFKDFMEKDWNNGDPDVEIKLTVAGHELDLNKVCEDWQKQVDRMVEEEARKMVKEAYGERLDKVHELLDEVANHIRESFGIKDEEEQ